MRTFHGNMTRRFLRVSKTVYRQSDGETSQVGGLKPIYQVVLSVIDQGLSKLGAKSLIQPAA